MRIKFSDEVDKIKGVPTSYSGESEYSATELNDDQYCFISGMHYATQQIADEFAEGLFVFLEEESETIRKIKEEIANWTMGEFKEYCKMEIAEIVTAMLDGNEESQQ